MYDEWDDALGASLWEAAMAEAWKRNPDEMIARFRKRHDKTPLVATPEPLVWDVTGTGAPLAACIVIRPWEGELLLSLQTLQSAPQALLRRPWLAPEGEPDEQA